MRTRADNQHVPDQNKPTVADIGLSRKEIHQDRKLRDAEAKCPGLTEAVLNVLVDSGEEPARAALGRAVDEVLGDDDRGPAEAITAASDVALHGKRRKDRATAHKSSVGNQVRKEQSVPRYPTGDRPACFAWLVDELAGFRRAEFEEWLTTADRGRQEAVAKASLYAPSAIAMIKRFQDTMLREREDRGGSETHGVGHRFLAASHGYLEALQEVWDASDETDVLAGLKEDELAILSTVRSRIAEIDRTLAIGV